MIFDRQLLLVFFLFTVGSATAQDEHLADSLEQIAATTDGRLGVAVTYAGTGETTLLHGHDHYPMMSVFKFPLALYILDQADKQKLSLDEPVVIHKKTWSRIFSPMLNGYPGKTAHLTIRDLTANIILLSDNVACDVLLGRIGGPEVLNNYMHALGIDEINIAWTEAQMAADPKRVYDNWCSPAAMNILLQHFYEHHIVSDSATWQLTKWMIESKPGPHRLKGLLTVGVVVAHKTGTSNTDSTGLTAATNDVGILTLPGGAHLYVTVFLTDSHSGEATREHAIALVGRLATDTYTPQPR
ncbi:MAG TPA: class A beta-lactamase [Puia sp.]|nr:class A beta-lactamase [Puia sp.]